jgi:putative hemolysin
MNIFTLNSLFIALILPISALASAGGSNGAGTGNPAEDACHDYSGKFIILNDTTGNGEGFCQFDRAIVDSWTLLRAMSGKTQIAIQAFLKVRGVPKIDPSQGNPASVYCSSLSGTIQIWKDTGGNEFGMCGFSDGSQIEEWTLFHQPTDRGYSELAVIFQKPKSVMSLTLPAATNCPNLSGHFYAVSGSGSATENVGLGLPAYIFTQSTSNAEITQVGCSELDIVASEDNNDGTISQTSTSYLLDSTCRYLSGTSTCYYGSATADAITINWLSDGHLLAIEVYSLDSTGQLVAKYSTESNDLGMVLTYETLLKNRSK